MKSKSTIKAEHDHAVLPRRPNSGGDEHWHTKGWQKRCKASRWLRTYSTTALRNPRRSGKRPKNYAPSNKLLEIRTPSSSTSKKKRNEEKAILLDAESSLESMEPIDDFLEQRDFLSESDTHRPRNGQSARPPTVRSTP